MDQDNLIPTVLFAAAVLELGMMPVVMAKIPKDKKMIVGFAMFSGAVMTGMIGLAFMMGWF